MFSDPLTGTEPTSTIANSPMHSLTPALEILSGIDSGSLKIRDENGVFRVVIRFSRHAGLVRDDYIITANTALVEKAWAYSRSHVLCTGARLGIGDALEDEVRRILTCVWDLTDSQAKAR